jgi:plastocyanin
MFTPRRSTVLVPFVLFAALALLLAGACGDDDDAGTAASPTTAPASPTTAAAASPATAAPSPTSPAAAASPTNQSGPRTQAIQVGDIFFSPGEVTVAAGTIVTWNWSGSLPHSVVGTFNGQQISSPTHTGSGSFEFTFNQAGRFIYQCGIHGASMSGSITVN